MKELRTPFTTLAATVLVGAALLACSSGDAAVKDLEKVKAKACSCKGDASCNKEAIKMAEEWAEKHKSARGGDQEKATKLMTELVSCNMKVGMALSKAIKKHQK